MLSATGGVLGVRGGVGATYGLSLVLAEVLGGWTSTSSRGRRGGLRHVVAHGIVFGLRPAWGAVMCLANLYVVLKAGWSLGVPLAASILTCTVGSRLGARAPCVDGALDARALDHRRGTRRWRPALTERTVTPVASASSPARASWAC